MRATVMKQRQQRSALVAVAMLLLCAPLLSTSAQMQVPKVRTTAAGENQFNPRNNAAQASDEYCGSGNSALNSMAAPISTLFSGSPSNFVQLRFNNLPAESATARFNFTLLQYQQNTTASATGTPTYYRVRSLPLEVQAPTLIAQNNQFYTVMLTLPANAHCGTGATRCVLRYVYDNTQAPTNQNSRVSCADVIVVPRSDVLVSVRAKLAQDQAPLGGPAALRRLLQSSWAQNGDAKLDIFQTRDQIAAAQDDWTSQQIRMADAPIVRDAGGFTMNFLFSDTSAMSAHQLAHSFQALGTSGLSNMFDLEVTSTNGAGNLAPTSGLLCLLLAAIVAMLML